MEREKTVIYFVPGLAASIDIFEFIQLPEGEFEIYMLPWLVPLHKEEPLQDYVQRMCKKITHKKFILAGVSFGGIVAQEMSHYCNPIKTIIISSVKHHSEFPKRVTLLRATRAYKLTPVKAINNIESFAKYAFGDFAKKRVELYQKYLAMRDETYLPWAIYNVLHWKQQRECANLIHIHGDNDHVFPIKNIKNCIIVKDGTHAMILSKAKKITNLLIEQCK